MENFFKKLFASLDNHTVDSYSGRKISTVVALLTVVYLSAFKVPSEDQKYIVFALLTFAAICLGLVTIPQLIQYLSGNKTVITETFTKKEETTKP